ncbi:concanavalin A-like lectin/glucanase [Decorospora gaudefroyi]|uniref:Concanavalin A-like lectin/glucanase n=1 Tax=Decorospora gaudefroyi TaxID=184978 RepID=A0A6A5K2U3_9PLEO|nr:concanavalin A-like lectin/glucanase [Decorospora gaudefroyi]
MHASAKLLFAFTVLFSVSKVAAECTRFSTNGSTAATYQFHRFYDFRNLHESLSRIATSTSLNDAIPNSASSKIISAAPWGSGWNARKWFRPAPRKDTVDMQYTPSSISISEVSEPSQEDSTCLSLHTTRLPNGTQLASELQFTEYNVTYASIRMSARIHGVSGAIAGFFTYRNDTAESDIELPTGGAANSVHFSNQPTTNPSTDAPIQGSTFNVSLSADQPTSTWNNYRLDWVKGRSAWYVNGVQSADTEVNVPDAESMIILNLWSNGGNFSGRMDTGGEAWFDIQWVELLFNATAGSEVQYDETACSVESSLGSPVPNASPAPCWWLSASRFWWMIGMASVASLTVCV